MKKMYKTMLDRLESKRAELKKLQEQFSVMCHNDMQSQCFEQNAIHALMVMQRLKSEIEELEYWELLTRARVKK